ncbi:MAG: hypothetical protein ACE15E_21380 [Acidobacteriota bacterium]
MRLFTCVCALLVCLLCVATAVGQSESERGVEVFAGFTRSRSDLACCSGNANGFHVGAGYTPVRFVLLAAEFSHALGPDPQYIRHLHFGPNFRVRIKALRPFARVMAAYSEHRTECATPPGVETTRSSSVALGGGLDLMVHPRVGIRVIALDRIRTQDQWDMRASFGAVFRLF